MKHVLPLTEADHAALTRLHQAGRTHRQRQRAQAALLSAQGFTLDQLAAVCAVDRDTVSRWLDAWRERGLDGLADAPKPGRPRKIDVALEAALLDLLEHPTPDLKSVVQAHLKKTTSGPAGPPSGEP